MAGNKEELRAKEMALKKKISEVPDKYKKFWERELKAIRKQLYGHE